MEDTMRNTNRYAAYKRVTNLVHLIWLLGIHNQVITHDYIERMCRR